MALGLKGKQLEVVDNRKLVKKILFNFRKKKFHFYIENFFTNPQYLINVINTDIEGGDGLCTIICACLQKYTRQKRQQTGAQQAEEYINLRLYKVIFFGFNLLKCPW
jgi:hypothetical protein